jgi:hypothetical protein
LVIESATFSDTFDFNIAVHPQVLFVEDTHGGGDGTDISIKNYYTNALDELGVAYEYIYRTETPTAIISKNSRLLSGAVNGPSLRSTALIASS